MELPTDDLIQLAIDTGKAGDKEGAKKLLSQAVKQDPQNARAWYLLSQVVDKDEQAIYCLEKALEVDPHNIRITQKLEQIRAKTDVSQSEPQPQPVPKQGQMKEKKKPNLLLIGIASVAGVCILCVMGALILNALGLPGSSTTIADISLETELVPTISEAKSLPSATLTDPPMPTSLPTETDTPIPTIPPPTNTPEIVPEVVVPYSGVGDAIVNLDIAAIGGFGVLQIQGNPESNHFAVTGYDANGNMTDLFVNTTEPYQGRRALNLRGMETTVRLEVNASGAWSIDLISLSENLITTINVPGSYAEKDDDVLLLIGGQPDTARVSGNANAYHFALVAFSRGIFPWDLPINTTDPYSGEVLLDSDTYALEFTATGDWTIEISSK